MTKREALEEARRRWGASANVQEYAAQRILGARAYYEVGTLEARPGGGNNWVSLGEGATWESAFSDADRQEKGA